MGDNTKIEWTDSTWTPVRARNLVTQKVGWHCVHASEGCRFCYAEGMNRRLGTGLDYKPGHEKDIAVFLDDKMLLQPLKWKRPRRIFVCSMTDMFAEFVPDSFLDRMFAVMALCPQHTFQVLTKRPERMRAYLTDERVHGRIARAIIDMLVAKTVAWREPWPVQSIGDSQDPDDITIGLPLPNAWLGTSVENQAAADERIPHLLATPAAVRFLSCEPLLGPIDLTQIRHQLVAGGQSFEIASVLEGDDGFGLNRARNRIDWVIVGGESGPNARPMNPQWARDIRDQCRAAGVPFHFKQWGEYAFEGQSKPDGGKWLWHYDAESCQRVGKKAAGRLLDGVEHNGFPQAIP